MTKCVVLSPDTNSPVDCLCLAKGLALGQARPAGPSRQAVLSLDIQNRDRYDVILANPPFGGKERKEVQQNFPIKTGETAFLFLQHFIKTLKAGGRAGIVIKNTFLSNADNASTSIRKLQPAHRARLSRRYVSRRWRQDGRAEQHRRRRTQARHRPLAPPPPRKPQ